MADPARAEAKPSTDGPCNAAPRLRGRRTLTAAYLYDGQLRPRAQVDANGSIIAEFIYANGINVADAMLTGGKTYALLRDHLGSVRLVVDAQSGAIAQQLAYDAFGQVTEDTSPGFQPFGFAGGLYDPDTGLVHFGAREYDASIGRWTSKDPIGFEGGQANLYVYGGNDPANASDPSGLLSFDDACKIASTCEEECARRTWEPLSYVSCLAGCVVGGLVWEKRQPYAGAHPDDDPDDDLLAGCQRHATGAQQECLRLGHSQSTCLNVYLIALRECLGRGKGY